MKRCHATDDKIRDKKLEYGINRQEAKISALSSGKTDKYLPIKFKLQHKPSLHILVQENHLKRKKKMIEDIAEKKKYFTKFKHKSTININICIISKSFFNY